jgi:HD-GYP domain-containing protein (c-di-GMP phosphodiesterase class II)
MGELAATLALAQDNAFGQPLESQLRSCLLAARLGAEMGLDPDLRATVYWVALLRYLGCTGHAHEVAALFGDEIAIRAQTLVHDAANPAEVMRDVVAFATAGRPPEERDQVIEAIHAGAREWAVHNFSSGCEVADMLARRLEFSSDVRDALRFTFERWNGQGFPNGASGEDIPLAMRIVHLSHDMEAIGRRQSPDAAISAAGERRDRTYDPALADLFVAHGEIWFAQLAKTDPWDAVLDLEPAPQWTLEGDQFENAVTVVADFIDLKSPYMAGHSRRCAKLCDDAAAVLGITDGARTKLRRAALVHDFGTTAIPNSIWDKPGPLTRAEFDRVELHPMLTEQLLRRSPAFAELNPVAAAHHERGDGSGYHRRVPTHAIDLSAGILAAADVYVAITTDRADRPALSDQPAAGELRRLADEGQIDRRATDAVLAAAGHEKHEAPKDRRQKYPGGLSEREVEVLGLAARGLMTREIAQRLFISPKTADRHIQNTYTKIGVSTRGAAALWAMQHGLVG